MGGRGAPGGARAVLPALLAGLLLAAPPGSAGPAGPSSADAAQSGQAESGQAQDPTRNGPRAVTRIEYDAGPAVLAVQPANGAPIPVDLHGELHVPSGRGPFPVVLLMHGRHATCATVGSEGLGHPCPTTPATAPVESYRGYGHLSRALAGHGYLVVSVDANGINTYDTADLDSGALARAELISRTLDLLAQWHTRSGPGDVGTALQGRVDLRRLGLMGHSRGGEGVARWPAYNRGRTDGPRYTAAGIFALAPTDFGDHLITDATPYAVLLPRCDGDVSDLQGADVFERSQYAGRGPLHQITVNGANHNWFNTVWSGDDAGFGSDTACGPRAAQGIRLSLAQQSHLGTAWMAAFFRRYVGGERSFDGMLTGRQRSTHHCTGRMRLACPHVVDLSWSPASQRRTTLLAPAVSDSDSFAARGGARLSTSGGLEVAGCDPDRSLPCPEQRRGTPSRSKGPQLSLTWDRRSSLALTAGRAWRGDPLGDVVVRLAVNAAPEPHRAGSGHARLRLQLTDARGRSRTVAVTPGLGAPEPPPGSAVRHLLLSDVRVPLRAFRGVDVTALRSVRLLLDDREGSVQLADLALHHR